MKKQGRNALFFQESEGFCVSSVEIQILQMSLEVDSLARFGGGRGVGFCILFLMVGAVIGGVLGELLRSVDALQSFVPYLVSTHPILNLAPFTLNLYVMSFTLGFSLSLNIMSILGLLIALYLFRKF